MSGIAYALICFGILYVIGWYVLNERNNPTPDGSKGLLAMSVRRQKLGGRARWRAPDPERSSASERQTTDPQR